jgi:protein-S-isoprenylcysteine O-methyltransferase Ste14
MFYAAFLLLVLLAVFCLWRADREYEHSRRLSWTTVTAAWVLHALHAGLIGVAAFHSSWPLPIGSTLALAVGVALLAQGLGFAFAAAIGFRSVQRLAGTETDQLVCSGVYRYSRNPQSVGWMLALAGVAVLGRSGLALLLVLLFWGIFWIYAGIEERHLERVFGEEYRRYRDTTPRYLGRPGARRGQ